MVRWYNKVEEAGFHSFNVIAATFYEHSEEIVNFYTNRSTNASAESFNSKIKSFKAELRGVLDIPFFYSGYQSSMPKHRVLQVSRLYSFKCH
jgi:transposase